MTYAPPNCLRRLRRNASLQPARLSLIESGPLEVSLRARSRARRRRMAMLAGPFSGRLRAASSRNETSWYQYSAFSISQWARTMAMNTSGAGVHDNAKWRVSDCTTPPVSQWLSMRPNAFNPGKSWCSANPLAEITVHVRVSLRPCPASSFCAAR